MYEEALAGLMPGRDLAQFVDTLNLRTQNLLAADRLASVIHPEDATSATLESRLNDYVGADQAKNGRIAVIDLSLAENGRPHSPVPSFWKMWTGEQERSIDWREIALRWQGAGPVEASE